MTLTEFVLARLAEDEKNYPTPSMPIPRDVEYELAGCGDCGGMSKARWLRECEAKRRIVEHASQCDEAPFGGWCYSCHVALCALASVYADHPDYREEWQP